MIIQISMICVTLVLGLSSIHAISNHFNEHQVLISNHRRANIESLSKQTVVRQSFQREPDYLEINPGESALMSCKVFDMSHSSLCIWQKDGKPVRMQQDGKYEWYGGLENGDCSLIIFKADINYDDGEWKCQVTSSSYDSDDALSSRPARLVVRIPPEDPQIYYNGRLMNNEVSLRVKAGKEIQLRCESQGGNPAAIIKWFIDNQELDGSLQKNETDIRNERRWNAISIIKISFQKESNGKELKCVAMHDAYSRKARERLTTLDILYAPIVRLERKEGENEFEADIDNVHIKCMADANPKPDVIWRKAGGESLHSLGEDLVFEPVRRGDGGTYYCLAKNDVAASDELSTTFEVLFPPNNINTQPRTFAALGVGERTHFECAADGYPKPTFEWLQIVTERDFENRHNLGSRQETVYGRGKARIIGLPNISYENEGKWTCIAKNVIKGKERKISSDGITVEVSGKPQVLRYRTDETVWFPKYSNANLDVVFCSNPKYKRVYWEWGVVPNIIQINEGDQRGRFKTSNITKDRRTSCYQATLYIKDVLHMQSKIYYLIMENNRGKTKFGVRLMISDPISMTAVVGIISAGLLIFIFALTFSAYTYKTRKSCFKDTNSTSTKPVVSLKNKILYEDQLRNEPERTVHKNIFTGSDSENINSNVFSTAPMNLTTRQQQQVNQQPSNAVIQDRMRTRSWMEHPGRSAVHYSQKRPPTPPNMVREQSTSTRPTLARFSDSLYDRNTVTNTYKEITIPRVLSQGKTPQNIDNASDLNSTSVSSGCSEIRNVTTSSEPRAPVIMYTELQFPPNQSLMQQPKIRKDSNMSDFTYPKQSTEKGRFEQSVIRSKRDMFTTNQGHDNFNHLMNSGDVDAITNRQIISSNGRVDV